MSAAISLPRPLFRAHSARAAIERPLPRWPFAAPFVGYPLAWILGLGDLVFAIAAIAMVVVLVRARRRVSVPPRFAIWLGFVAFMLCSVAAIDSGGRLIGFVYRAVLYVSLTIMALYVYAAQTAISTRSVLGTLTVFWLVVVAGGFLGVFFPLLQITTPLAVVLPHALTQNELVHEMVYRRTTQFDPGAYTAVSPRPSAPFLYTNGWGMAYALLIPVVVLYISGVRGRRRVFLVAALVASLFPALSTLNRGMLLGLAVAAGFIVLRQLAALKIRLALIVLSLGTIALVVFPALPTTHLLLERLAIGNSTEVRTDLYAESWQRTLESPILGFGAPRPSETAGAPSAGTQGQLWMVLFSHGIPAALCFVGYFIVRFFDALRRRGPFALVAATVLLVFLVEIVFYGALASGLAIALVVATTLLRTDSPVRTVPIGGRA